MLIGIKEDVAKINAMLEHLGNTDNKADQALELARMNHILLVTMLQQRLGIPIHRKPSETT